jgi:hypothetical protein
MKAGNDTESISSPLSVYLLLRADLFLAGNRQQEGSARTLAGFAAEHKFAFVGCDNAVRDR